jgi:hypothetical protein
VETTCGCCHRRGEGRFCGCVITICRRCSYCLRHCRCSGPRCVGEAIDEVMERVMAELNDPTGPFGDLPVTE